MTNPELLTGLGAAASIFLTSVGSAASSVHAGKYALAHSGVLSFAPIVISGVLAIYGIIVSVLLAGKMSSTDSSISETEGYRHFAAGLAVGLACLASGVGMARFLEDLVAASSADREGPEEPLLESRRRAAKKVPVARFLMVLVFLEAIGLCGLIVALVLIGKN